MHVQSCLSKKTPILLPDLTADFCHANKLCAVRGTGNRVNFLVGRKAFATANMAKKHVQFIWTSFHNFSPAETFNSSDWYDADPRRKLAMDIRTKFRWSTPPTMPDKPVILAQVIKNRLLIPIQVVQPLRFNVACEHYFESEHIFMQVRFQQCPNEKDTTATVTNSITESCYDEAITVTVMVCVNKCAHNVHCRSVYYNGTSGKCISILYVRAYLPDHYREHLKIWTCFRKI
ncbi:PAN domain protein [Opisthorchis viverrini]|uniref:PAN domain protein n=1 Tax=Opisthorchis viverrini TaxID=6198 RepID=A0A1S8WJC1_OPIVI|nr:PAN domain protein [Opisthorchis viverrini]